MIRVVIILAFVAAFAVSCSTPAKKSNSINSNSNVATNMVSNGIEAGQNTSPVTNNSRADEKASGVAKKKCLETKTGDDVVMKSQTFPIDFDPFSGSCFVTAYNPEYDDPPMESHYSIYKNNKKIFDFPEQFNGATFGCWVDGVSFQDLNNDNLKEVIVVGKCSTKDGSYNENMVYINTGKTFIARPDGNNKLSDFTKIKEIADFVQDNKEIFFK